LVISHDIPSKNSIELEAFLEHYAVSEKKVTLALNIKSDGLQNELLNLLARFRIEKYFVFDMSIPECIQYIKKKINFFSRQSECESEPSCYQEAEGIWLDEFNSHWITNECIQNHVDEGKKVCIVSPELHGRSYAVEWEQYKSLNVNELMICTDFPEQAEEFFNG
jgi:hypothetical protein